MLIFLWRSVWSKTPALSKANETRVCFKEMVMSSALLAALLVFALVLLLSCWALLRRVPEGQVLAVRRLGGGERVLTPGIRFLLPLAERVVRRVHLVGHSVRLERRLLACRDLAAVAVEGQAFFQFLDPLVAVRVDGKAHERIAAELSRALAERASTLSAQALCAEPREQLAAELKQRINRLLVDQGLMVTRLQLELAPMPPS